MTENSEIFQILDSPLQEGYIRLKQPSIFIFPAGSGDSALLCINNYKVLVNGGSLAKPWFWRLNRHHDKVNCMIATDANAQTLTGFNTLFERKVEESKIVLPDDQDSELFRVLSQHLISPGLGVFFANLPQKISMTQNFDNDDDLKAVQNTIRLTNQLNLDIRCLVTKTPAEPITLFFEIGVGRLQLYPLLPESNSDALRYLQDIYGSVKDGKVMPIDMATSDAASVCCLLVWFPSDPHQQIVRVLFPGNCSQDKILEAFDKVNLNFLKSPRPTGASMKAVKKNLSSAPKYPIRSETTKSRFTRPHSSKSLLNSSLSKLPPKPSTTHPPKTAPASTSHFKIGSQRPTSRTRQQKISGSKSAPLKPSLPKSASSKKDPKAEVKPSSSSRASRPPKTSPVKNSKDLATKTTKPSTKSQSQTTSKTQSKAGSTKTTNTRLSQNSIFLSSKVIPNKLVTSSKPMTSKPSTSKPAASKPATSKPATSKPATSKPATSKPTTSKPTTSKPATSKPATSKPATSKPATSKPLSNDLKTKSDPAIKKEVLVLDSSKEDDKNSSSIEEKDSQIAESCSFITQRVCNDVEMIDQENIQFEEAKHSALLAAEDDLENQRSSEKVDKPPQEVKEGLPEEETDLQEDIDSPKFEKAPITTDLADNNENIQQNEDFEKTPQKDLSEDLHVNKAPTKEEDLSEDLHVNKDTTKEEDLEKSFQKDLHLSNANPEDEDLGSLTAPLTTTEPTTNDGQSTWTAPNQIAVGDTMILSDELLTPIDANLGFSTNDLQSNLRPQEPFDPPMITDMTPSPAAEIENASLADHASAAQIKQQSPVPSMTPPTDDVSASSFTRDQQLCDHSMTSSPRDISDVDEASCQATTEVWSKIDLSHEVAMIESPQTLDELTFSQTSNQPTFDESQTFTSKSDEKLMDRNGNLPADPLVDKSSRTEIYPSIISRSGDVIEDWNRISEQENLIQSSYQSDIFEEEKFEVVLQTPFNPTNDCNISNSSSASDLPHSTTVDEKDYCFEQKSEFLESCDIPTISFFKAVSSTEDHDNKEFLENTKCNLLEDVRANLLENEDTDLLKDTKCNFGQDKNCDLLEDINTSLREDTKCNFVEDIQSNITKNTKSGFEEGLKYNFVEDASCSFVEDTKYNFVEDVKCELMEDAALDLVEDKKSDYLEDSKSNLFKDDQSDILKEFKSSLVEDTKCSLVEDTKCSLAENTKPSLVEDTKCSLVEDTQFCPVENIQYAEDAHYNFVEDARCDFVEDTKYNIVEDARCDLVESVKLDPLQNNKSQLLDDQLQFNMDKPDLLSDARIDYMEDKQVDSLKDDFVLPSSNLLDEARSDFSKGRYDYVKDSQFDFWDDKRSDFTNDLKSSLEMDTRSNILEEANSNLVKEIRSDFEREDGVGSLDNQEPNFSKDSKSSFLEDARLPLVEDTRSSLVEDTRSCFGKDTRSPLVEDARSPLVEDTRSCFGKDTRSPLVEDTRSSSAESTRSSFTEDMRSPLVEEVTFKLLDDKKSQIEDTKSNYEEDAQYNLEDAKKISQPDLTSTNLDSPNSLFTKTFEQFGMKDEYVDLAMYNLQQPNFSSNQALSEDQDQLCGILKRSSSDQSQTNLPSVFSSFYQNDHVASTLTDTQLLSPLDHTPETSSDPKILLEEDSHSKESDKSVTPTAPLEEDPDKSFELSFCGDGKDNFVVEPNKPDPGMMVGRSSRFRAHDPPSKSSTKRGVNYVDLTYVPHHCSQKHVGLNFFKHIRSRYYVLSGLGDDDPHPEVLDGLLNGVSSWNEIDDNCLDVTVIPTKNSKSLMEWFGRSFEDLKKAKIHLVASECKVQMHNECIDACKIEL